ncbi:MAG: hypothetical protein HY043_07890 [Verrucomicrobia bacterium]|nr:hypothetical protein [Verrucomicrobiota bacterium]
MNDQKPNTPAQRVNNNPDKDAKAAYEAKQAKDVKASVDRQKAADNLHRHESAEKANKEPQAEGHLGHTHDHLPPQLPFHLDKRESDNKEASRKSAHAPKPETQEKDNDYFYGMSQ